MKAATFVLIVLVSAGIAFYFFSQTLKITIINPLASEKKIVEKSLEKYSFARLRKTTFSESKIIIGDVIKEDPDFTSRMFFFHDGNKKVSGLMNIPKKEGTFPVIVMNRGFVEKEKFTSGEGTRRTAEEFAKNGFITLAPDFLGYGESDMPSTSVMEERFQTYTMVLSLLASLQTLQKGLEDQSITQKANLTKIGLWGHSNGGHITLAILAITGKSYPTVLWAPVSKPFPYSILYYTDEYDDHGKALRKVTSDFEKDYDAEKYSVTNYFKWIKGPIQLHQGLGDEALPYRWSDILNQTLKADAIDISYFTYPSENHNFNNGSWNLAVLRSIAFYTEQFAKLSE